MTRAARLFPGWYVVGGSFLTLFVAYGVAYSFAAFFTPLSREFGATRASISGVFAVTGFLYFGLGAVSGPLADRFAPRPLILLGGVLIAAGLLLASRAQALWQVYATYCLGVGIGVSFVYLPGIVAVQRWFVRRRGFASGLAVAGIGAGNLAGPPLAAWLIDVFGWRATYAIFGVAALLIVGVASLLVEGSPERRSLRPDGGRARAVSGPVAEATGIPLAAALRSRTFWLLYAAGFTCSLALFIPFVHLSPYAEARGVSSLGAAWLVGLIGAGSITGRLVLGNLADRLGRRSSLAGAFAGMAVMMAWWLVSQSLWSMAIFAYVFGVCYGAYVALLPALATDYFGARRAGAIIGLLFTSPGVGNLIGPTLAGKAYDLYASYSLPIAAGIVANIIALACVLLLASPAHVAAVPSGAAP
jgi:MFS family permease